MPDDSSLDRNDIVHLLLDRYIEETGLTPIAGDDTLISAIAELLIDLHLTYGDMVGDAWEFAIERVDLEYDMIHGGA